jgi:hypothetical protein
MVIRGNIPRNLASSVAKFDRDQQLTGAATKYSPRFCEALAGLANDLRNEIQLIRCSDEAVYAGFQVPSSKFKFQAQSSKLKDQLQNHIVKTTGESLKVPQYRRFPSALSASTRSARLIRLTSSIYSVTRFSCQIQPPRVIAATCRKTLNCGVRPR